MRGISRSFIVGFSVFTCAGLLAACGGEDDPPRAVGTGSSTGGSAGTGTGGAGTGTGGTNPGTGGSGGTNPGAGGSVGTGGQTNPCYLIGPVLGEGDELIKGFEDGEPVLLWHEDAVATVVDDAERGGKVAHWTSAKMGNDWGTGTIFFTGCQDVSYFTGISFWAKSPIPESTMSAVVRTPELYNYDEGGACVETVTEKCDGFLYASVNLTAEWTHFKIPFTSLRGTGPGYKVAPFSGSVMATDLRFPDAELDVYVDDFAWYKDAE